MTRAASFTQGDISKLLKGAKAAGLAVARVVIDPSGKIVAEFGKPDHDTIVGNEWDAIYVDAANRASSKRQ